MAGLVIGGQLLFVLGHHQGAALGAHQDLVARILEFGARDDALAAAGGEQSRFIDEVHQVRAGKSRRAARHDLEIDVGRQRHLAHVNFQNLFAADHVRVRHNHLTVEAAGAQQRRIEHVGPVGRGDQDDAVVRLKASN